MNTVKDIVNALSKDKFIYIIGNGGSAATASHFACDLTSHGYKAISLVDNQSILTRIGNDIGYDYVFEEQLRIYFAPGDVLVAISASGNSENLIKAVEYVGNKGITIAIVGFDGGKLADMCDLVLHTETKQGEYELAEDKHLIVCHAIAVEL